MLRALARSLQLSTISATTIAASSAPGSIVFREQNTLAADAKAEAEKKRRRRAAKAQLREWVSKIDDSFLFAGDKRAAAGHSRHRAAAQQLHQPFTWESAWRNHRSRRKGSNQNRRWARARQEAGRDPRHEKAWESAFGLDFDARFEDEQERQAQQAQREAFERFQREEFERAFDSAWRAFESSWRREQHQQQRRQERWHEQSEQRQGQNQQQHQTRRHGRAVLRHMNVLGLSASELNSTSLKAAFYASARAWHPDLHYGAAKAAAEERFKAVQQSYNALCEYLSTAHDPD